MDPYLVLGVPRNCTRQEVQKTFRAKVRREHPDRGGEEQKFIRICLAYKQILSDVDGALGSDTSARAGGPTYVDLLRNLSGRSDAGKTRSGPRQSAGSFSDVQLDSGVKIAGLVALLFFLAEFLMAVLDGSK